MYVDDIIVISDSGYALSCFVQHLSLEFAIKDLGSLSYSLDIEVHLTSYGLFLNQTKYAMDILDHAHMLEANSIGTSITVKPTVGDTTSFSDPSLYCSIASALQYLTFIRLDLAYCVNYLR